MLSRSIGLPSRREGQTSIFDTHGTSGNFFQIQLCPLQHLIHWNWIHGVPVPKSRSFIHSGTEWGTLCAFGSHTCVTRSLMFKKQVSVSHSSTESEIIWLGAGLRLDVILALELWDLIVSVSGTWLRLQREWERPVITERSQNLKGRSTCWITLIVFLQTSSLRIKKFCCICLMTAKQWSRWPVKEWSPTMRHVYRTQGVAFDCLFDRINLDPKIQNPVHRPEEISKVMSGIICCDFSILAIYFSSKVCSGVMAKRSQHFPGEERVKETWWVESFVVLD